MSKMLRSLTIVPPDLYVERSADRQLAGIVANMGRPGYVLVARQMGKTNLLLHAKGMLGGNGDVFTYLDVSNRFPDLRSFLRNIVDLICETDPALQWVQREILSRRTEEPDRLPHKEHEWELRRLLVGIAGKLIVCLDEIDALANSDYSDQVFSFIRSVYFSGRANFPEFGRLTYLLSGVAEPAEIIKNRDVSPFNIGEKILLQDFTFGEFEDLLQKSNLRIPPSAKSRIFWWANGHPRMSWDLCSHLEDLVCRGDAITSDVVDDVVRRQYFSEVGMPPVDHIKKLAEESLEIRDALVALHYGRGSSLSDSTRTKLYLAGISRFTLQASNASFKNRILEEALSEAFLLSIAPAPPHEDPLQLGQREFSAGRYAAALASFDAVRAAAVDVEDVSSQAIANFWIGRTRFALGEEEPATLAFLAAREMLKGEDAALNSFYLGHLSLARRDYRQAISAFEEAIAKSSSSNFRFEAMIDLAAALYAAGPHQNSLRAEELCRMVCRSQGEVINSPGLERSGGDTVAIARHTLASILYRRGRKQDALIEIEEAMSLGTPDVKIRLLLLRSEISPSEAELQTLKAKATVLSTRRFGSASNSISFDVCREVMVRLELVNRLADAEEVAAHIIACAASEADFGGMLEQFVAVAVDVGNLSIASLLLEQALLGGEGGLSIDARRKMLIVLLSIAPEKSLRHAERLLCIVEEQSSGVPSAELFVFNNIVFYAAVANKREITLRALALVTREPSDIALLTVAQRASWGFLSEYLNLFAALTFDATPGSIEGASRFLSKQRDFRYFDLVKFKPDFLVDARKTIERLLGTHGIQKTPRRSRRVGRNDIISVKYGGDQVRRGKRKIFAADIAAGKCSVID